MSSKTCSACRSSRAAGSVAKTMGRPISGGDQRRDGRKLFPGQNPIGQNLAPEQPRGSDPRAGSPTGPVEREQRVVGVLAAYREDGEVDGQASQALYRKPLTDTDPSVAREPAPGKPDPAYARGHLRAR